MRPITAVAVLAMSLLLGTCSRPQPARYYGAYPPTPLPPNLSDQGAAVKPVSLSAKKPAAKTKISATNKPPPRKTAAKTKSAGLKAPLPKVITKTVTDQQVRTIEPDPAPKEALTAAPSPATFEARFKAAQTKSNRDGVQTLTQEDIEGLSYHQIKELRGY